MTDFFLIIILLEPPIRESFLFDWFNFGEAFLFNGMFLSILMIDCILIFRVSFLSPSLEEGLSFLGLHLLEPGVDVGWFRQLEFLALFSTDEFLSIGWVTIYLGLDVADCLFRLMEHDAIHGGGRGC